ncbi:MAG: methionyl-tRNA formyltransferase [Bacteroidaceae bacterium]|nr:methionyl-tRNA formyltransferase [Bacteroidaceae bacterium]
MEKKDLRIVYLGTPEFAVESLRRLVTEGYHVVGVVTMPDKAIGRHQNQLQPSPVKVYAKQAGIPVLQPQNLKEASFLEQLRAWRADLQIVVAFRMLPEAVWAMPRLGTFNLHASLLPQYRGAAPINWAIMNGERETGITTFFLKHEIDTGNIIDQVSTPILPDDDFGTVHDRLMVMGGDLVVKTVDALLQGHVDSHAQSDADSKGRALKPAPKIFRETCQIRWERPAQDIHNHIRGLSPSPGAWSVMKTPQGETTAKIFRSRPTGKSHDGLLPGQTVTDGRSTLSVQTGSGLLAIEEIQVAGKKRMAIGDFLRGQHAESISFQ